MVRRHLLFASVSVATLLTAGGAGVAWADDNQAKAKTAPAADSILDDNSTIIVTGTRESGRKIKDSPTSVEVIDSYALEATGQTNALDALKQIAPSINTMAMGGDISNLVRSFSLKGLTPGQTLVLINGKRRHSSSYINVANNPFNGSNPVDLDLIPLSAIDHVEILRDGAAAQYGTDAIAGVINIILKNSDHGGTVSALGGVTSRSDGGTAQAGANAGTKLGDDGFLQLSADYNHHEHTNRGGNDARVNNIIRSKIFGDPSYDTEAVGLNFEKPLNTDISVYGFGTFAHRYAESIQNYRTPTQLGVNVQRIYPSGFFPVQSLEEHDIGVTAGIKGKSLLGWGWDLSTTYGSDDQAIGTIKSINANLLNNTGNAQTDFYDGGFYSEQQTTNLDFNRAFNTGLWSAPLNVAFGGEHRYETYHVLAGEYTSYAQGGAASYPGFTRSSASNSYRNVYGTYLDLSTYLTPEWQATIAGRHENYDDVGSTEIGKLSTRYDIIPEFGLRGSIGTGFHAPTLAQQNFATTSVSPTQASAILPVTSVGAKLLGAPDLKPEKSTNVSVGFVSEPVKGLNVTLDAYQINILDRIVLTGNLTGAQALAAIQANGNVAPPGVSYVSAKYFTNGADTKTRGVDLNADYVTDHGDLGTIKWVLGGNYNITNITQVKAAPAALRAAGVNLLDPAAKSYLTTAAPRTKVTLAATYFKNDWEITLRETRYGSTSEYVDPSGAGIFYLQKVDAAFITDITVKYNITDQASIEVGANNVFDVLPNDTSLVSRGSTGSGVYPTFSPYGFNGAYYFTRLAAKF